MLMPRFFSSASRPEVDLLKRALKNGGVVDASAMVLGSAKAPVLSNATTGVHRPPFMTAAFQYAAFGEEEDQEDNRKPGHLRRQTVREFERLSLAARQRIGLTGKSLAAEQVKAKAANINLNGFYEVHAEDILEALAWVADELGPDQGKTGSATTAQQLAMRGGLQLIGCRITPRGDYRDGIRLVNARQPISLRLIGCVVECPILLAHCHLVSLDLSGSALNSLDATGLVASGSVHLRRTMVRSPVAPRCRGWTLSVFERGGDRVAVGPNGEADRRPAPSRQPTG